MKNKITKGVAEKRVLRQAQVDEVLASLQNCGELADVMVDHCVGHTYEVCYGAAFLLAINTARQVLDDADVRKIFEAFMRLDELAAKAEPGVQAITSPVM